MTSNREAERAFSDAVGRAGPALLAGLAALEVAMRRLAPDAIPRLAEELRPLGARIEEAGAGFRATPVPAGVEPFASALDASLSHAAAAVRALCDAGEAGGIGRVLEAMHVHCRAQEALFPLRRALPPVSRFFAEPAAAERLATLDPDAPEGVRVGMHEASNARDTRGGFTLYVPESYDGSRPWPLVVALHGGSGHGADFLWTWVREARSRGFLLMAPTSRGPTWSLAGPDRDADALASMVDFAAERWEVDRSRTLLTGLSDGATYTLLCGLRESSPFTALAPVSGVLHPANFSNGNLSRARDRRIRLVHGALDWMFPVTLAREAARALESAGADLVYREIADLSHTYPREENGPILEWFDPTLALAEDA